MSGYEEVVDIENVFLGQCIGPYTVWLPCADMDNGVLISIVLELPKQEYIAIVLVVGGFPVLVEGHAIEVGLGWVAHHANGIKVDLDKPIAAEVRLQGFQVLFLILFAINNLRLQ